ncbi:MAG TPA: hypothetical protein VE693_05755 [Gaiellaceae bacterium]|nr:hypothetical protein [Gaiellaceae bacterium]
MLLFLVAACGCGVTQETGGPASSESAVSGEETAPATTTVDEPAPDDSKARPPPIILISQAGKQLATPGSSCVQYTDPDTSQGMGVCSDMAGPLHPDQLSIIHAGEPLLVVLGGAFVTGEGTVSVNFLGCPEKNLRELALTNGMSETHFRLIDLEPGAYQLDVFARFGTNDGRQGDLSGTLGLLIDPDRAPEIIPTRAGLAVCPFSG